MHRIGAARRGASSNVIALVVATVIIAVVIALSLVLPAIGPSVTRTATSNGGTSIPPGIELKASLNATTVKVGQNVSVAVSIYNNRSASNAISPSSDWQFQGVPAAIWPPCLGELPVEVAVLAGNYTAQELQSVANSTFSVSCFGFMQLDHVTFQPDSDQVTLSGGGPGLGQNQTRGPYHLSLNFTTNGYWDLKSMSEELKGPIIGGYGSPLPAATPFIPGTYTIAVEDEWGQVDILHLTVK